MDARGWPPSSRFARGWPLKLITSPKIGEVESGLCQPPVTKPDDEALSAMTSTRANLKLS